MADLTNIIRLACDTVSGLLTVTDKLTGNVPRIPRGHTHPPLPVFESYVKGLVATTPAAQEKFLVAALMSAPAPNASTSPKVSSRIVRPNARHRPTSPRVRRVVSQM